MKKFILPIVILLSVSYVFAQSNPAVISHNKEKKSTEIEYGLDENGKTGKIKRTTLLPARNRRTSISNQKELTPEPTVATNDLAEFSKSEKIDKTPPQRSNEVSIVDQINMIEQEIARFKNLKSESDQLHLQKLEKLLEKKKIERVLAQ